MKVRRIVTGHNAAGKAVVKTDEQIAAVRRIGAGISGCEIWSTDQMPIDNSAAAEAAQRAGFAKHPNYLGDGDGTTFRINEFAPVAVEQPAPADIARLQDAYGLRNELDSAWAARPLEFIQNQGKPTLLIEDHGGEVLARLVDKPGNWSCFCGVDESETKQKRIQEMLWLLQNPWMNQTIFG
jgi:hypothetical protein